MQQPERVRRAIGALEADIAAALTKATRGGLSHADAVLVAMGSFNGALRRRLGEDWINTLVGVLEEPGRRPSAE